MTRVQRLLLACLHQDPDRLDRPTLSSLDRGDWDVFLALAARQHVRPAVFQRLSSMGGSSVVPAAPWRSLDTVCHRIALRNLRLHQELANLIGALGAEGIPVILLKGAHLARAVYGNLALREMNDLDVMVRPEHLARAAALVLDRGYAAKKPFAIDADVAVSKHLTRLSKADNLSVEIHWNISEPRRPYTIDPSGLWERAVPFPVAGHTALALSSEDLLLHLCLHCAYQHRFEFGLRSLCDLSRLLDRHMDEIEWALVVERAREWNWTRGVRLALTIVTRLLGPVAPNPLGANGHLDEPTEDIIEAATLQVMSGFNPSGTLGRGLSMLDDHEHLSRKLKYIGRCLFLAPEELRREYPWESRAWYGSWVACLCRAKDLLWRHTTTVLRRWVLRERGLIESATRQRRVREWLLLRHP